MALRNTEMESKKIDVEPQMEEEDEEIKKRKRERTAGNMPHHQPEENNNNSNGKSPFDFNTVNVNMSSLFEAKIKVKCNVSGFIPAGVSIKVENGSYALRFRNISKLELGFKRFLKSGPLLAMDFAFLGFCGEDENVGYEELPKHVCEKNTERNTETIVLPRMEMTLRDAFNAEES